MSVAFARSNNTLRYKVSSPASYAAKGPIEPLDYTRAIQLAYFQLSVRMDWMDWLILEAIFGACCELSFNHVYTYAFGGSPCYMHSNKRVYSAVGRLIAAGYVKEGLNNKGKKRWTILPAGRRLMDQLNKKALEIIQGWQAEQAANGTSGR